MKKLVKRQKGFTIIEVLIVLAIAGLILLIVFLAVPALQRNSRNTQRKHDVSVLLSALNEYLSNSNNQFPSTCSGTSPSCFIKDMQASFYDNNSNKVLFTKRTTPVSNAWVNNADWVRIYNYAKCGTFNGHQAAVSTGATYTSVVINYAVETSSGTTPQCQDS